jgi:hypothetical protein
MPKDECAPVFGKRDPDPSRLCALDMVGHRPVSAQLTLWAAGSMIAQRGHEVCWGCGPTVEPCAHCGPQEPAPPTDYASWLCCSWGAA